MPFAEDLSPFFQTADFATTAALNSIAVDGIFDAQYYGALNDVFESAKPAFTCAVSDVPTVAQGDTLVIGSTTYKVRNLQPDGTGIMVLILEKQ
jgi:polygalacturonase